MDSKYRLIAAHLTAAIERGEYPVGSRLPTLQELTRRFGVARGTARAAVAVLISEGRAVARQGSGTLVSTAKPVSRRPPRPPRPPSDTPSGQVRQEVVLSGWTDAAADVAARLGLASGSLVVHRIRHHHRGSRVVQIDQQWVPAAIAERIENNTGHDIADQEGTPHTSLIDLMRRAGLNPVVAAVNMNARMPEPPECATMRIPPTMPVLEAHHVVHDSSGKPVETTTTVGSACTTPIFTIPIT